VCLRQLAQGRAAQTMQFWRFVSNPRVSVEKLIEGWSDRTREAVAGRHVLAIQDTSELRFATTADRRRGLGKVKKGSTYGALLHAMIGVDADSGALLGLVGGRIWTRQGDVATPHAERPLEEKESERWVEAARQARQVLAGAAMVTLVSDRESDFYANWALSPAANVHLLTRLMNDHAAVDGGTVRKALSHLPVAGRAVIELRERPDRRARTAHLVLRFASMVICRPKNTIEKGLPATIPVNVVQVVEPNPPKNAEPVDWILLTTHDVSTLEQAWRIVEWYRRRWIIEQFFRTMKQQGLRIEDSQLTTADRLCRLIAIAASAAAIVMQLVQARDGHDTQSASLAFAPHEIKLIALLDQQMQGNTARQKNPHPPNSLAWAAWVIAKLGGWHEYQARPPGPITFFNGLTRFRDAATILAMIV
jgi:Transposase DDE domain